MKKFSTLLPVAVFLLAAGCSHLAPAAVNDSQPDSQNDDMVSPAKDALHTYKSEAYSFSLQYPPDWKSYQETAGQSSHLFVVSADSQMQVTLKTHGYTKQVSPLHWLDTTALANRPSYFPYIKSKYLDYGVTQSTVQGKPIATAVTVFKEEPPSYKPTVTSSRENENPWLTGRVIKDTAFQCQESLLCVIEGEFPDKQEYRDTMEQILSTRTELASTKTELREPYLQTRPDRR